MGRAIQEITARREVLEVHKIEGELIAQSIDVTLPGRGQQAGHLHPVTRTLRRMVKILARAGFQVHTGPEVEDEFHNFTALNIPENHPARAMHDTFYLESGRLLRTHTSPVQIRAMRALGAPIRLIAPGLIGREHNWREKALYGRWRRNIAVPPTILKPHCPTLPAVIPCTVKA